MASLCVSQPGEFKNTKNTFRENYNACQKLFTKRLRGKKLIFCHFFPFFSLEEKVLSRFWPFLCMRSSKNTIFEELKKPENLKNKSHKK
jgi:hypothetical protein